MGVCCLSLEATKTAFLRLELLGRSPNHQIKNFQSHQIWFLVEYTVLRFFCREEFHYAY
jgi:hypothetical protein